MCLPKIFLGITRSNPDIGAVEYESTLEIEKASKPDYKVYPNPFKDTIYLNGFKDIYNREVYDITGKKINLKPYNAQTSKLDFSTLQSGIHIIKTNTETFKLF